MRAEPCARRQPVDAAPRTSQAPDARAPFDTKTLRLAGPPEPLENDVFVEPATGLAHIAFALDGTYVYASRSGYDRASLVSVGREGESRPVTEERRPYLYPRLAPDGASMLVTIAEHDTYNIWMYEAQRDRLSQLTFEGRNFLGRWIPDVNHVTFTSSVSGSNLSSCSRKPTREFDANQTVPSLSFAS